jgi:hypothetical protein
MASIYTSGYKTDRRGLEYVEMSYDVIKTSAATAISFVDRSDVDAKMLLGLF